MDLWFFSLTFLLLMHNATAQSVRVWGVLNDFVVLPCEIKQNSQVVFWQYRDSKTVCEIIDGTADFSEQDPAYRDRVQIFLPEVNNGNFSIILNNLKEADAGPYDCIAPNIQTVTLELIIKEKREEVSSSGQPVRRASGLLTFLLGCVLLYSATF